MYSNIYTCIYFSFGNSTYTEQIPGLKVENHSFGAGDLNLFEYCDLRSHDEITFSRRIIAKPCCCKCKRNLWIVLYTLDIKHLVYYMYSNHIHNCSHYLCYQHYIQVVPIKPQTNNFLKRLAIIKESKPVKKCSSTVIVQLLSKYFLQFLSV